MIKNPNPSSHRHRPLRTSNWWPQFVLLALIATLVSCGSPSKRSAVFGNYTREELAQLEVQRAEEARLASLQGTQGQPGAKDLRYDSVLNPITRGEVDFMNLSEVQLGRYQVKMTTSRGELWFQFYPELAPNHVRNFLDLCSSGFYDGVIFHRVIPGFMIQGGDPEGTGRGSGRRLVGAEFSNDPKYKHVRGVLSMARAQDPNSASSQFFVMHAAAPHLDGKYSVFGKLMRGFEALDAIANTPSVQSRPVQAQTILSTEVLRAN